MRDNDPPEAVHTSTLSRHAGQDAPGSRDTPEGAPTKLSASWLAKLTPPVVSIGLVSWLVWRVTPSELLHAAAVLEWRAMVPLTFGLAVALYLWDAVCLRWLFSDAAGSISYIVAVHARGTSYLAGAVNYWLGQGMLAWMLARVQQSTLLAALSRCFLLTYHDLGVLLAIGWIAAITGSDARAQRLKWICGLGVASVLGLAMLVRFLPSRWRDRLRTTRFGASLGSWSWDRSLTLCLFRVVYFTIIMVYVGTALHVSGVRIAHDVLFRSIPIVLLAEALPISVSGFGTRETALLYLLNSDQADVVLAFGLLWSAGLMLGRTAIGIGHLWLPRTKLFAEVRYPAKVSFL